MNHERATPKTGNVRYILGIALLLVLTQGCGSSLTLEEKPLVGKWFCEGQDYPVTWIFAGNHTFGQSFQFREPKPDKDYTWSVTGGELILSIRQDNALITSEACSFKIDGDALEVNRKQIGFAQHFVKIKP